MKKMVLVLWRWAQNNQVTVTGSLKFDICNAAVGCKAVTLRRQWAPHCPVWIATSTREGEEGGDRRTSGIVTPRIYCSSWYRHPERFPDAINLVRQAGIAISHDLQGKSLHQHEVVLAMGELMLLYGMPISPCWRFTG